MGITYKILMYLESKDYISIVLLCIDSKILHSYTPYTLLSMKYVCMFMLNLFCWLKGLYHDHNTTILWKVYSHANVSKVKEAVSIKRKHELLLYVDMSS